MTMLDDGRIEFAPRREPGLMAKDPVCGMDVEIARAAATADFDGRTYYFCSPQCEQDFNRQPLIYSGKERTR